MNDRRGVRRFITSLAAALVAFAPASPGWAADDVSQTRVVPGFDRVRVEGAFTTEIVAGEHHTQVVVTASGDNVGRITTEVHDGELVLSMRSGTNWFNRAPKVHIELPKLRSFSNQGAGATRIIGLGDGAVEIENDGAASIVAAGRATHETITLNGTGKIDTTAVEAHDVDVDNNGVGVVRVRASGTLSMNVNGVGEIRYTGDPSAVESHVNGIGHIGRI